MGHYGETFITEPPYNRWAVCSIMILVALLLHQYESKFHVARRIFQSPKVRSSLMTKSLPPYAEVHPRVFQSVYSKLLKGNNFWS